MPNSLLDKAFNAGVKLAARRGLKEIRNLVNRNQYSKANELASKPGVLSYRTQGHQISDIGQGSEGLATLVANPREGLSVRKLFDNTAVTPESLFKKELVYNHLGPNNPDVANLRRMTFTPSGTRMHFTEHVPGPSWKEYGRQQAAASSAPKDLGANQQWKFDAERHFVSLEDKLKQRLNKNTLPLNLKIQDLETNGNVRMDPTTKRLKAIDFIPTYPGQWKTDAFKELSHLDHKIPLAEKIDASIRNLPNTLSPKRLRATSKNITNWERGQFKREHLNWNRD